MINDHDALISWTQNTTISDLRYQVRLLMRGNPIEEFETTQKVSFVFFLNTTVFKIYRVV